MLMHVGGLHMTIMQVPVHVDMREVVCLQEFPVGQYFFRRSAPDNRPAVSEHMNYIGDFLDNMQIVRGVARTMVFPFWCAC